MYEIVAVDDRSTDKTMGIMESYVESAGGRITILRGEEPVVLTGKQTALDKAIGHSRGQILLTTDADCVVPVDWVMLMVKCFADAKVGVVAGFSAINDSSVFAYESGRWRRLFLRMQAFELMTLFATFAGGMGLGIATACTGNSLAFRRKVYQEIGGFKAIGRTVAEDNMLIQRVSAQTLWKVFPCCLRRSLVTTEPKATVCEFLSQRIRWASNSFENRLPVLAFMIAVYGMNLLIYPALILSLLGAIPVWIGPVSFAMKVLPEYMIASAGSKLFSISRSMKLFPLVQPFHTMYILICGLAGLSGKVRWKGREYGSGYRQPGE
jgi:cellulose synthase/poly-beta-1,6-N-acetylglucosamine synthase-like glycosyltransferase